LSYNDKNWKINHCCLLYAMDLTIEQFEFRLLVAFSLGALIGLERQWRHKIAGMRTTALVAVGAALFILMAEKITNDASSAARVAAQIVTGIGFLGAGVIMKEGFNVTGLNTAATIWCSGAIGSLAGLGFWYESLIGTAVILFSHILLRPISKKIDKYHETGTVQMDGKELKGEEISYLFKVICSSSTDNQVRIMLLEALDGTPTLKIAGLQIDDDIDTKRTHIIADIRSPYLQNAAIESVVSLLSMETDIFSISWEQKRK
jgi:putative Mg2+ transporter-C (MgtC) family protein